MAWFLDSSAVAKRYIVETGTAWVRTLTDPSAGNDLYLANITQVEVVSAIKRRERAGGMPTDDANDCIAQFEFDFANQYQTIEVTEEVLTRAVALVQSHTLRAYDAVQLATALELHDARELLGLPALTVVSSDVDLNTAAVGEGLVVEDPNAHP